MAPNMHTNLLSALPRKERFACSALAGYRRPAYYTGGIWDNSTSLEATLHLYDAGNDQLSRRPLERGVD